jgi:hypothetical protein
MASWSCARPTIVIFDKFLPEGAAPRIGRRLLNLLARRVGTDINRRLSDLLAGSGRAIVADRPSMLGGSYRTIVVQTEHCTPIRSMRCSPVNHSIHTYKNATRKRTKSTKK